MILAVEREWGKWPGWLASLGEQEAARLLGEWRARHEKPKTTKGKKR